MCKSKEDLERAKQLVKEVLERLGLELAEDKTDEIDFLGFTFEHLRKNKNGNLYYVIKPSNKSVKKFKSDIKSMTPKRSTFSFGKWKERLNPVLRGKYNYFLIANKACKEVKEALKQKGYEFHGYTQQTIESLDGYVRQRLRVNFSCRGKKHGGYNQGRLLNVKYTNIFFVLYSRLSLWRIYDKSGRNTKS